MPSCLDGGPASVSCPLNLPSKTSGVAGLDAGNSGTEEPLVVGLVLLRVVEKKVRS